MTRTLKPVLKWVGGKTQLLPTLRKKVIEKGLHHSLIDGSLPYIEPFIGGGALFLDLQPSNAWINDKNSDLIRFYLTIKNKSVETVKAFECLVNVAKKYKLDQFYNNLRNTQKLSELDSTHAAKFYYLNKSCFNGVYRVNQSGEFNVPFNKSTTIPNLDYDNFYAVSEFLNRSNVRITNVDALQMLEVLDNKPHFIYLDPPYVPVKKGSFTGYTSTLDKDFHEHLAKIAHNLASNNHYILISNSDCEEVRQLYKNDSFQVSTVSARNSVNSDGKNRKRTETLITNF